MHFENNCVILVLQTAVLCSDDRRDGVGSNVLFIIQCHHITSDYMEKTEAGLQRPLFLRNRLKTNTL